MTNVTAISVEHNTGMSYATLIPVRLGELSGEAVQVCNARDLHVCLGVGRRFATWIVERIKEYGFVEGCDFASRIGEANKSVRGGHNRKEYDLTVDMAKELAMVERTEAGRRIRRYFIACEKKLRQIAPEAASDILHRALNPQQQFTLKEKVDNKVACLAKARQRAGYHELWSSLKSRHQVAQYRDIAQAEFEDACQYIESFSWDGEWLGKEPSGGVTLTDAQAINLSHLLHSVAWVGHRWHQGIGAGLQHINRHLWAGTFEHVDNMLRWGRLLDRDVLASLKEAEHRVSPGGLGGLRPNDCIAQGLAA